MEILSADRKPRSISFPRAPHELVPEICSAVVDACRTRLSRWKVQERTYHASHYSELHRYERAGTGSPTDGTARPAEKYVSHVGEFHGMLRGDPCIENG